MHSLRGQWAKRFLVDGFERHGEVGRWSVTGARVRDLALVPIGIWRSLDE